MVPRLFSMLNLSAVILLMAGCQFPPNVPIEEPKSEVHIEALERLQFHGRLRALAFFQGGEALLAAGCGNPGFPSGVCRPGIVQVWKLGETEPQATVMLPSEVTALATSPDGTRWAAGDREGRVVLSTFKGQGVPKLIHQKGEITTLAFSPDGKWIASGSVDVSYPLGLLEFQTTGMVKVKMQFDPVSAVAFSPDSKDLAIGTTSGYLSLWSIHSKPNPEILVSRESQRSAIAITSVSFSADGRLVAYGDREGRVAILERNIPHSTVGLFKGTSEVTDLAFSPSGPYLVAAQENGKVIFLKLDKIQEVWSKRYLFPVTGLAYSPDGQRFAVAAHNSIHVYRSSAQSQASAVSLYPGK